MAIDGDGNLYVTGFLTGDVNFGDGLIRNQGENDIFVASFTSGGTTRWSKGFGAAGTDHGTDIEVDDEGNVFVTGSFEHVVDFGEDNIHESTDGTPDVFVASYDTDGVYRWSKQFGGTGTDSGNGIDIDEDGNIYVAGSFDEDFNIAGEPLTTAGARDAFIVSYAPDGAYRWSVSFGSDEGNGDISHDIAVDGLGNSYVTGFYQGEIISETVNLPAVVGSTDVYVASYDSDGEYRWAQEYQGDDFILSDVGHSIAVDDLRNVYLTGTFSGDIRFGGHVLTAEGNASLFLASLEHDGDSIWSDGYGDSPSDAGNSVAVDERGNVLVTGYFSDHIDFGPGAMNTNGGHDCFVTLFNRGGTHLWQTSFGGDGMDSGKFATVAGTEGVVVVGSFAELVDFDGIDILSSDGERDIFILFYRLDDVPGFSDP